MGGLTEDGFRLLDLPVVLVVVLDLDWAPITDEEVDAWDETIPKAFDSLSRDGTPFLLRLFDEETEGGPTIGLIFLPSF